MDGLQRSSPTSLRTGPFSHRQYTIRRPFFTLFGSGFRVTAGGGDEVMFVRHKLLTWRDEWNVYTDDSERVPLLRIKARAVFALNAIEDVHDAATGEKLGALRNRGLASTFRDTYDVLDANDVPVGVFQEDSLSLLRRLFPILNGHWQMEVGGRVVARLDQEFRFFTKEFTLTVEPGVDPRLAIGCAMLALLREIVRQDRESED